MKTTTIGVPMQTTTGSPPLEQRKRIIPKRLAKISLNVARLKPGRYVMVLEVPEVGDVTWETFSKSG